MKWNLIEYINIALPIIVTTFGSVIHKAIKTPNDAQRAISLSKIAEGIAAIVVIQNPNATWATLLKSIVEQLKVTSNETTTSNVAILERAAAAALIAHGVKP